MMRYTMLIAAAPLVAIAMAFPAAPPARATAKHAPAAHSPAARPAAARAPADWSRIVARTPEGGTRMGNPNARVKLIEYGARTCPTCALFTQEGAPALAAKYVSKGQVSYEFRDYPVHGALDLAPILLGQCVPAGRFFPVLSGMMAQQQALIGKVQVSDAKAAELQNAKPNVVAAYLADFFGYTDFMVKQGLPLARAKACLADPKAVDAIVARANAANATYRIAGTPTFIINGKVVPNAIQWSTLEPALQTALAAK